MNTKEILEYIKKELEQLSPDMDYNFSKNSEWKDGSYILIEFKINEK